jgi:hypothetical protein
MVARSAAGVSDRCERIGFESKTGAVSYASMPAIWINDCFAPKSGREGGAPAASSILASHLSFHEVRAVGIIAEEHHATSAPALADIEHEIEPAGEPVTGVCHAHK